jgi:hypothetical protein
VNCKEKVAKREEVEAVDNETRGIPARQTLAIKVGERKTSVEAGR